MNKALLSIFFIFLFYISCKNQTKSELQVYANDFEKNDLSGITNGVITQYNNSVVLGNYNKGGFSLTLNNLPKHDLISISFDLYIHDSWDGNKEYPDGPDIWQMVVDNNMYINTTFSNAACVPGNFCLPQSYPFNYPNNYNNPKTGAYRTDLPGICGMAGPNGTTLYKITKTFSHSNNALVLKCLDKLVQENISTDQKCDESWSVDNIIIKAISL
ncbi:MAG: hypothetical protein V4560_10155 [Bacteroidota bacterium]